MILGESESLLGLHIWFQLRFDFAIRFCMRFGAEKAKELEFVRNHSAVVSCGENPSSQMPRLTASLAMAWLAAQVSNCIWVCVWFFFFLFLFFAPTTIRACCIICFSAPASVARGKSRFYLKLMGKTIPSSAFLLAARPTVIVIFNSVWDLAWLSNSGQDDAHGKCTFMKIADTPRAVFWFLVRLLGTNFFKMCFSCSRTFVSN